MAKIRVLIHNWSEKTVDGKLNITNPIIEYLLNKTLDGDFLAWHFEAPKTNGRPNKGTAISVCRGEVLQSKFDELESIPGVTMIPAGALDKSLGSFNNPTKNKIITTLDSYSLSPLLFDETKTLGDLIRGAIKELNPSFADFGSWESLDEWT